MCKTEKGKLCWARLIIGFYATQQLSTDCCPKQLTHDDGQRYPYEMEYLSKLLFIYTKSALLLVNMSVHIDRVYTGVSRIVEYTMILSGGSNAAPA